MQKELTDRDLPGLTPQAARQAFEALAVRCGWDLAQAHGDGVTRWLDPMTRDLYLAWLEGHSSALDAKDAEIAALKSENLKLEALCDKTYVAKGADAYNHACEVLETWQEKRVKAGKEPGCQGSLCGGMEWLYAKVDELEKAIAQAVQP